jgi:putative ABC transport system permease protein
LALIEDLHHALRTIRRDAGFASVTISTLALGIGANTAMFSVVYAVLLKPFPYRDPSRLALLYRTSPTDPRRPLVMADFELLRDQSRSFQACAVYFKNTGFSRVTLTGIAEPESVQGGYVSANLFQLLGVARRHWPGLYAGRRGEERSGAVLSHTLWQRRFGSAPDVAGRAIEIDGMRFRVIGVMPAEFQFPARDIQFWAPITTNRYWLDRPAAGADGYGFYARWNAVARPQAGSFLRAGPGGNASSGRAPGRARSRTQPDWV